MMNNDQQQWLNQRREEEGLPALNAEQQSSHSIDNIATAELSLQQQLQSASLKAAPEGLAARIVDSTFKTESRSASSGFSNSGFLNFAGGFACCLLLMVTVWQVGGFNPNSTRTSEIQLISINHILENDEFSKIQLDLNSDKFIAHALIQLDFPESIQLENYYGTDYIEWEDSLFPGANQLSLPIQYLQNGNREPIYLSITTDDGVYEFTIQPPAAAVDS